jgi:hypothetical protein
VTEPQPPRAPIELRRPRDLGALLRDGLRIYFRGFPTFIAIALAVVVPVEVIVRGIGLGQFTAEYDKTPSPAAAFVPAIAEALVIWPLVTSMCIFAALELADGRKPRLLEVMQRGLDVFSALLVVTVMFVIAFLAGLFLLLIGGLVVVVYLAFAMQAAVIDGRRGTEALQRSVELVQRSWWRVLGIAFVAFAFTYAPGALVSAPLLSAAESSGEAVFQLLGGTIHLTLWAPPLALIMTLLYFDQRARKGI